MNNQLAGTSLLASAFTKRITQLGMSRRQLTQRTGLSRQTLHNIEKEGRTDLKPSTLAALDRGLNWEPGTCLALINGDGSVILVDVKQRQDMEGAYRWRIVERIQRMPLEDLERMVSIMEGEMLGTESESTVDLVTTIEQRVMERLSKSGASHDDHGGR